MILCWAPETQSAIHDHSNSHCLLKVLDGTIEESIYDWPEGYIKDDCDSAFSSSPNSPQPIGIHLKNISHYQPDQLTYMHDKIGLHRIRNPSPSKGAVSLHLYCPPYQTCQTFCENSGVARPSGNIVFYSINGEKEKYIEEIYSKLNEKLIPCIRNPMNATSGSTIKTQACGRKGV